MLKVSTYLCILFLTNQFPLNNCFKRYFKSFLSPFQCKRLLSQKAIAITPAVPLPGQTKRRGTSRKWRAINRLNFCILKPIFTSGTATNVYSKMLYSCLKKRPIRPATFPISFLSVAPNTVPQLERFSMQSCKRAD